MRASRQTGLCQSRALGYSSCDVSDGSHITYLIFTVTVTVADKLLPVSPNPNLSPQDANRLFP